MLWVQKIISEYLQKVKSVPCADCGVQYEWFIMELDHLPQFEKVDRVSRLARSRSMAVIVAEVAKCDVVCANCHTRRTYLRQHP